MINNQVQFIKLFELSNIEYINHHAIAHKIIDDIKTIDEIQFIIVSEIQVLSISIAKIMFFKTTQSA